MKTGYWYKKEARKSQPGVRLSCFLNLYFYISSDFLTGKTGALIINQAVSSFSASLKAGTYRRRKQENRPRASSLASPCFFSAALTEEEVGQKAGQCWDGQEDAVLKDYKAGA